MSTRQEAQRRHHYGPGAAAPRHGLCIHAELPGECGFAVTATRVVLDAVGLERDRQEAKWGEQNHPDGTGPGLVVESLPTTPTLDGSLPTVTAADLETWARRRCQDAPNDGGDTYERILTEEWAEALASPAGSDRLRRELVQVAAVAVAWIEKLDREKASR